MVFGMNHVTMGHLEPAARTHTVRSPDGLRPRRSPWLFHLFRKYSRRYVRRHFHALRLSRSGPSPGGLPGPVIVVVNHPSWWDPLVGLVLTELFPADVCHYVPMESAGLKQYPFLERLGFFGVEAGTAHGARAFLQQALAVLSDPSSVLWITPQGEFVDPRARPLRLKPGIGHLVCRLCPVTIVPLALEYPFWNDRCPEALACFGPPTIVTAASGETPQGWTARIAQALEHTQDRLAIEAGCRDPGAFVTVLRGTSGVGGIYDAWRRLRTAMRGERFDVDHQLASRSGARAGGPLGEGGNADTA